MRIQDIETPALIVDRNIMLRNIEEMAAYAKEHNIVLRPHVKAHKTPEIAKMQIDNGAIGITVATLKEAKVMSACGINDITIAYPLWQISQLEEIARIMENTKIYLIIDSQEHGRFLNEFWAKKRKTIQAYIKIDSGLNRCGFKADETTGADFMQPFSLSNISIKGLLTHAGHSYGSGNIEEVKEIACQEANTLLEVRKRVGLSCKLEVSAGSTPTAKFLGAVAGIDEMRPGNYVFYDRVQAGLGVARLDNCALTVLSTIISRRENKLVIDAGSKSLALDSGAHGKSSVKGYGEIKGDGSIIDRLSEEHGIIDNCLNKDMKPGQKVRIIPNHACPVVNLADKLYIVDGEEVVDIWEISARGH